MLSFCSLFFLHVWEHPLKGLLKKPQLDFPSEMNHMTTFFFFLVCVAEVSLVVV